MLDRIDCVRTVAASTKPHVELMKDNPLSKIPTLVLDDGTVLYDSPVICEYLDQLHGGAEAASGVRRRRASWRCGGRRWATASSISCCCAAASASARIRPDPHLASFATKRRGCLRALEQEAARSTDSAFSLGHIAIGCALSYLDFRFAAEDWRKDHPRHRRLA